MPDLHDPNHVAGWESENLHDLAYVSWVRYVLCRSCTTSHNCRLDLEDLDRDLSDV